MADVPLSTFSPLRAHVDAHGTSLIALAAPSQRRIALAIGAVLLFSAGLRLYDLGGRSLTHDEAWRATFSVSGDPGQARRMPPLQYLTNRWVLNHVAWSEWALRAPYALAGIGCCVLLTVLAWRTFDPRTAFFVACVAAGHPGLSAYSRIVKVFGLTAFAVALLVLVGLYAAASPTNRRIVVFTVTAVPCILMSFAASLVVAAWGLLLVAMIIGAYRRGAKETVVSPAIALTCAAILATVLAFWYWWLAGSTYVGMVYAYNAETFRPWPAEFNAAGLARWAPSAILGAYRYATGAEVVWAPLKWLIWTAATFTIMAGLPDAWRSVRPLCTCTLLLLLIALVLGATGQWPLAAQPTSTFLVPIAVVFMGCGLASLHRRLGTSAAFAFVFSLVALVPAARAARHAWPGVSIPEHIRPVIRYTQEHKRPTDGVFVYYSDHDAFRFYWTESASPLLFQPGDDRGRPEVFAQRFESFAREHGRAWFVAAHSWQNEVDDYLVSLSSTLIPRDSFATATSLTRLYEFQADADGPAGPGSPP